MNGHESAVGSLELESGRGYVNEGDAGLKEMVVVAERKDGRLGACIVEGGDGWVV